MSTLERALTAEEFARLPADEATRDELVEGFVVSEPRPAFPQG